MIIMPAPRVLKEDRDLEPTAEDTTEPFISSQAIQTEQTAGLQLEPGQYLVDPDYYWFAMSNDLEVSFEDLINNKK
jgi:hypothetical protein